MKHKCLPHDSLTAEQWAGKRKGSGLNQTAGGVLALHAFAAGVSTWLHGVMVRSPQEGTWGSSVPLALQ